MKTTIVLIGLISLIAPSCNFHVKTEREKKIDKIVEKLEGDVTCVMISSGEDKKLNINSGMRNHEIDLLSTDCPWFFSDCIDIDAIIDNLYIDTAIITSNFYEISDDSIMKRRSIILYYSTNDTSKKKEYLKEINDYDSAMTGERAKRAEKLEQDKIELEKYYKTPAGRIQKKHPDWSRDDCEIIVLHKVRIGFTKEQCLSAWGRPYDTHKHSYTDEVVEYLYYNSSYTCYLHLKNGILTEISN